MKKIIIYVMFLIIVCFLIPAIFTNGFNTKQVVAIEKNEINEQPKQQEQIQDYSYSKYGTIKLLHTATNQIEEVKLDEYLVNVVSAEMPADFELEALKAQGIVARTYTIYKITTENQKHGEANICDNSSCCQAWISKEDRFKRWEEDKREANWNKLINAVNSTIGKMITYENKPINAFFHSNSGGTTEMPINVWGGGSGYAYLQVVQTAGEETYTQYNSEVVLSKQDLVNKIKEKYSDIEINFEEEDCVQITENTSSGRAKTVKFGNKNLSGVETRTILGLRSTNFEIIIEGDNVKFAVKGYGHGVGMSQTGADALAKQGKNYEEIIKHFYVGVEIKNM